MEVEESSGEVLYTLLAVLITAKSNSEETRTDSVRYPAELNGFKDLEEK